MWTEPSPGFPFESLGALRHTVLSPLQTSSSDRSPDGGSSWAACDVGGDAGDVSAGHQSISVGVETGNPLCLRWEASFCGDWPQELVRSGESVRRRWRSNRKSLVCLS